MTFTKVTNTGIGSTGTVLLQNLDVIGIVTAGFGVSTVDVFTTGVSTFSGNATFGGNVSIGGTLTYEDVTNVDSVGLITARNGIEVTDKGVQVGTGATVDSPANNALSFLTNGSEAVRIDSNGRLGIGTASVNTPLHVHHSTTNGVALFESGDAFCNIIFKDSGSNNSSKPQFGVVGDDFKFTMHNGSDSDERVRIKSTGNIGIKTATPRGQLHICQGGSGFDYGSTGHLVVENDAATIIQILTPSTHGGSIHFGDENNGMAGRIKYDHDQDSMRFFTSNNERVTIRNNGRLGIGTTAATNLLHINTTAQNTEGILLESKDNTYPTLTFDGNRNGSDQVIGTLRAKWNGTQVGGIRFESGDDTTNKDDGLISFQTSHDGTLAERMRITESGQLLIGTSSAASADNVLEINSTGTSIIKVNNTDDGVAQLSLTNTGSSNGSIKQEAGIMRFLIANTEYMYLNGADLGIGEASPDHRLHVNSGTTNGVATFESTDGYAHIFIKDNGTHATGTYFGVQSNAFRWVTHDGSSGERLRLTSDGYLLIGGHTEKNLGQGNTTTGVGLNPAGRVNASRDGAASILLNRNNSNGPIAVFYREGVQEGYINVTTSDVSYVTSASDRTLKKNFEDWTENTLELFKNINPQKFNFIHQEDSEDKIKGYVAQDLVDSFPEAYPKDDDGKYHFNPSGMVVYLMKALQEATIKIETLEAEVSALKGG